MNPGPDAAGLRLLVFGGRHFAGEAAAFAALDAVRGKRGVALVIEGGASGADAVAWRWAASRGVPCLTIAARWSDEGRRAGPIRNRRMIDEGKPDAAVGFPGGPGTADMRRRVLAAGVPLWEPLTGPPSESGVR